MRITHRPSRTKECMQLEVTCDVEGDNVQAHERANAIAIACRTGDNNGIGVDTTAVPIWAEQPHYKHHSIRLKCKERVTCLFQWKGGRMSV